MNLSTDMKPPRHVSKPWGHELIYAVTDKYVGKILHIKRGESLSLQFHKIKDETIFVLKGKIHFSHGTLESLEKTTLSEGQSFHIAPGLVHRMEAIEETDLLEVSTPELDDVVRLEDRYGRTK